MDGVAKFRAPVCVGLDPVIEKLPATLRKQAAVDPAAAIAEFSEGVIEAVAPHVPCIKFQSACYEQYGSSGFAALERSMKLARDADLEVILDAKRGDIGLSAAHYAAAAFDHLKANWMTVSGYLGEDSLRAFTQDGRGAFVLVRTSNPGGDALQEQRLEDGRTIAEAMGDLVAELGRDTIGRSGFSALGAVVGATRPKTAQRLRERLPAQIFLVPGYGAQGGGVDEVLPCFLPDGRGAIVTASRSVIFAYHADDPRWQDAVADAAAHLAESIGRATGWRS